MMIKKIAVPILNEEIFPRFDLATEVLIITVADQSVIQDKKIIVLPRSSADELCHILLSENISTLICCAIEDEYYEFLKWKEVDVFDGVVGNWTSAFDRWTQGRLSSGDILTPRMMEGQYIEKKSITP